MNDTNNQKHPASLEPADVGQRILARRAAIAHARSPGSRVNGDAQLSPSQKPTMEASASDNTLADRIRGRRDVLNTTDQGGGEAGGDDGQQQTVARTNLFTTLGTRMTNAGQDLPTPTRSPKPVEDNADVLKAPTPPMRRGRSM